MVGARILLTFVTPLLLMLLSSDTLPGGEKKPKYDPLRDEVWQRAVVTRVISERVYMGNSGTVTTGKVDDNGNVNVQSSGSRAIYGTVVSFLVQDMSSGDLIHFSIMRRVPDGADTTAQILTMLFSGGRAVDNLPRLQFGYREELAYRLQGNFIYTYRYEGKKVRQYVGQVLDAASGTPSTAPPASSASTPPIPTNPPTVAQPNDTPSIPQRPTLMRADTDSPEREGGATLRLPKLGVPYLLEGDENLIETEVAEAKVRINGGQKTCHVPGSNSPARTRQARPIIMAQSGDRLERVNGFELFRMTVNNGSRQLVYEVDKEPVAVPIAMTTTRLSATVFQLTVKQDLAPGEYSLSPHGSSQIFLFEVY